MQHNDNLLHNIVALIHTKIILLHIVFQFVLCPF